MCYKICSALAEPVLIRGNESEVGNATVIESSTPAENIEATPVSVTKVPVAVPVPIGTGTNPPQEGPACPTALTFEASSPDPSLPKLINFTEHLEVQSLQDCAKLCYSRKCAVAGFSPPLPGVSERSSCLLSYGDQVQCGQNPRVSSYNESFGVELRCVQCGAEVGPSGFTTPPESGTTVAGTGKVFV